MEIVLYGFLVAKEEWKIGVLFSETRDTEAKLAHFAHDYSDLGSLDTNHFIEHSRSNDECIQSHIVFSCCIISHPQRVFCSTRFRYMMHFTGVYLHSGLRMPSALVRSRS